MGLEREIDVINDLYDDSWDAGRTGSYDYYPNGKPIVAAPIEDKEAEDYFLDNWDSNRGLGN